MTVDTGSCALVQPALSDAERELIKQAALLETAVGSQGTRFFEDPYGLKVGRPGDAARGLQDRMRVDQMAFFSRIAKGIDGIEEEAEEFAEGSPEHCAEIREIIDYVLNQETSEKAYPNGIRDKGRNGVRPSYFTTHSIAQQAGLSTTEVFALRIYTTLVYKDMNDPLRDDDRYAKGVTVPLPVLSFLATEAIKKLRVLRATSLQQNQEVTVWRGLRDRTVSREFMQHGGTELAFMSTTTDLRVAVRYSLSRHSLLLKIVSPNFMSLGAELQWLSAFPGEAEVLYPPLTYAVHSLSRHSLLLKVVAPSSMSESLGAELRWLSAFPNEAEVLYPPLTYLEPTGRTDRVDAVDRDGNPVTFTVVEVTPYI
jgi:hypothetical protein